MTHASVFSGIGGPEIAAAMLGWENLFHCEINPFGRAILDYWFPKSKSYEDITKTDFSEWRGKVNVLSGGFPCFVAGTKVLTSDGYKNIESIGIGDKVLTKDGDFQPVNAIMSNEKSDIVRLKAQGMFDYVTTTSNHPFWIGDKEGNFKWKNAGDIKKGDYVAYRCIEGNDCIGTEDFWRMIGRFVGNGWILDGKRSSKIPKGQKGSRENSFVYKVVICCSKKEIGVLSEIIAKAGYHATKSVEKTVAKFIICNKNLHFFCKQFGRYAFGKQIAPIVFNLDYSRKKAFFEGYLSADGYIDKNGSINITTVSEELAIGTAQIARDIYHRPVSISKKTTKRKCIIEGREVRERPQYCVTVAPNERYGYYKDGFVCCLIKKIEHLNENKKTYNIGVEKSETYTVYGCVVHNCQPFSFAGKRRGADDDRYLWPYMFRCIDQVQPDWVIGENVAGILTMVEQGKVVKLEDTPTLFGENDIVHRYEYRATFTIERICKDLEAHGYEVQPILIPACAVGAPHKRDRVFIVGHKIASDTKKQQSERMQSEQSETSREKQVEFGGRGGENGCEWTSADTDSAGQSASDKQSGRERQTLDGKRIGKSLNGTGRFGVFQLSTDTDSQRGCEVDEQMESELSDGEESVSNGWKRDVTDTDITGFQEEGTELETTGTRGNDIREGKWYKVGERWRSFPSVSPVYRGNDGFPFDVDCLTIPFSKWRNESIKAYGNAIVPQVMYEIFRAIEIVENH